MTSPAEFSLQGRGDAERELQRVYRQWRLQGFPGGGPAETALIDAGMRLAEWRRLSRHSERGSEASA